MSTFVVFPAARPLGLVLSLPEQVGVRSEREFPFAVRERLTLALNLCAKPVLSLKPSGQGPTPHTEPVLGAGGNELAPPTSQSQILSNTAEPCIVLQTWEEDSEGDSVFTP